MELPAVGGRLEGGGGGNGGSSSHTIAYRVDPAVLAWLQERATPRRMSVHEYARHLLGEAAQDARQTDALRAELTSLARSVAQLREDLAVTLEILLASLTGADPVQVRLWIDDNLRGEREG